MELKKCIVLSDSFKGTLSSREICRIAKQVFAELAPACTCIALPVADGGEGTVDCFHACCGGRLVTVTVTGPFLTEKRQVRYALLGDGTAVIECASSAGLPLVQDRKDPLRTTTYGIGEQMAHAQANGAKRIILGLGGSATNDGGCGAAAALGVRFFDENNEEFLPTGGTLCRIRRMDAAGLGLHIPITVMCDVENPLFGERGAAYVFAPQKGADEPTVKLLDEGLRNFGSVLAETFGKNFAAMCGAGAAGGFGAGAAAFFGGSMQKGIDIVLQQIRFDELLQGCDLVITGEGRLDRQSLNGKVISGVAKHAKARNVPVVAIVGSVGEECSATYAAGISAVFPINRRAQDLRRSRRFSSLNYRRTLADILRLILAIK